MINLLDITGFEWDQGNRRKNEIKQREAEEVFENIPLITVKSKFINEDRFQVFGQTEKGKELSVIFTLRESKIRIISAKPQSKKERSFYNEKRKEEGVKANS